MVPEADEIAVEGEVEAAVEAEEATLTENGEVIAEGEIPTDEVVAETEEAVAPVTEEGTVEIADDEGAVVEAADELIVPEELVPFDFTEE